jgi:hypothetical protein
VRQRGRVILAGGAVVAERPALALGRPEADHPVAADDIIADLRTDPVGCVGDEPAVAGGIEALGGLEQPDVSLLDDVFQRDTPAPVLHGDGSYERQAGAYEAFSRFLVSLPPGEGEGPFVGLGERGEGAELGAVGRESRWFAGHGHENLLDGLVLEQPPCRLSGRSGDQACCLLRKRCVAPDLPRATCVPLGASLSAMGQRSSSMRSWRAATRAWHPERARRTPAASSRTWRA